eukprot:TRINITY_DN107049_c0_g1_i1.p1 TRINITY_DN107049_c0_g1~~TRINITY_DN107049_c0_g1_i1.p1  ORF type:complete len:647 (-),score=147.47 TRINITY_DN107049_c0_g1_i1:225-2165(-)
MAAFAAQPPSRHAQYGEHWGEGAARCFSLEADILDEDHAVRLMPVPDSFVCPISAAIMVDPVATVDGCVYERPYIERWFRERRQQGHRITSPITGLELPSATLMPLVALQRAIEAYLAHRPELKREHMAGRSFEEAAQILQTDLFEKQAAHAGTQDKLKRLKQANKALLRTLHEAEDRILQLEQRAPAASSFVAQGQDTASSSSVQMQEKVMGGSQTREKGSDSLHEKESVLPESEKPRKSFNGCIGGFLIAVMLLFVASIIARFTSLSSAWPAQPSQCSCTQDAAPSAIVTTDATQLLFSGEAEAELGISSAMANPALASQLELLRQGSLDEKQRAVFMLRVFAAETVENQAAIVKAGALLPLVELLQHETPTLREEAARALWNLARNNKEINARNQVAISKAGAILPLIHLLEDSEPRVRVVAAAVLNDLATDNGENQVAITQGGAIGPLVAILQKDEAPALVMAASLLKSLAACTSGEPQLASALGTAVPPLVALLKAETLLTQEQATSTLGVLAAHSVDIKTAIVRAGAVMPLVERLRGDMMQGTAAVALRNLAAKHPDNQVAIAKAGAVPPLVKLLEDGMPLVREEAAQALWNLADGNLDNQLAIVQAGAAISLVALLKGDAQEQATLTLMGLTEGSAPYT